MKDNLEVGEGETPNREGEEAGADVGDPDLVLEAAPVQLRGGLEPVDQLLVREVEDLFVRQPELKPRPYEEGPAGGAAFGTSGVPPAAAGGSGAPGTFRAVPPSIASSIAS